MQNFREKFYNWWAHRITADDNFLFLIHIGVCLLKGDENSTQLLHSTLGYFKTRPSVILRGFPRLF